MKFKILLVFLVFLGIYTFKLPSSFYPDTDFTRDMYEMIKIAQGKMTLIGPALRVGIFAGPYYYYLFTPILAMSHCDTNFVLYFNAFLFAAALVYLYWKIPKIYPVAIIGISNFYLLSARHPGNGYSYLPLLLIFVTTLFLDKDFGKVKMVFSGLLAGIIVNFHPLTIIPIIISVLYNWKRLTYKLLFGLTFSATFLPLLFFEYKHSFVISKGFTLIRTYTFSPHYLYSFSLLFTFLVVMFLHKNRQRLLMSVWLTGLVLVFPFNLYNQTTKTLKQTEDIVQKVINAKMVSGNTTFNLISITDEKHLVPMGHEYRFAFRKYGLKPLDENNYADARELLVFVETDKINIGSLSTWETEQFGYLYKPSKDIIDGVTIYKYAKENL